MRIAVYAGNNRLSRFIHHICVGVNYRWLICNNNYYNIFFKTCQDTSFFWCLYWYIAQLTLMHTVIEFPFIHHLQYSFMAFALLHPFWATVSPFNSQESKLQAIRELSQQSLHRSLIACLAVIAFPPMNIYHNTISKINQAIYITLFTM